VYLQIFGEKCVEIRFANQELKRQQTNMIRALFISLFFAVVATVSSADVDKSKLTAEGTAKFHVDPVVVYNSTTEGKSGWVSYMQCDSRWGSNQLGWCSGTSICNAGCAMSSVAMMLTTLGRAYDPGALNSWLDSNGGYSGCDIYWASVDKLGVTSFQGIEYASYDAICSGLSQMHGIIGNVNGGGHWVLLTGCDGKGNYYVNDPYYQRSTYSAGEVIREAVYH
jgi:hypothetical protein